MNRTEFRQERRKIGADDVFRFLLVELLDASTEEVNIVEAFLVEHLRVGRSTFVVFVVHDDQLVLLIFLVTLVYQRVHLLWKPVSRDQHRGVVDRW